MKERPFSYSLALHLIAIFFVIINISGIKIAGISKLIPLFDLMIIFYFTVFKKVFSIWFIFFLGLWNDGLNGNQLGATSLCYILMIKLFEFMNYKMMIRDNFKQIWQQFIFFCFLFLLAKWLLLSILNKTFYNIATPFIQLVLSSVIYIPMHKFFDYLKEKLIEEN